MKDSEASFDSTSSEYSPMPRSAYKLIIIAIPNCSNYGIHTIVGLVFLNSYIRNQQYCDFMNKLFFPSLVLPCITLTSYSMWFLLQHNITKLIEAKAAFGPLKVTFIYAGHYYSTAMCYYWDMSVQGEEIGGLVVKFDCNLSGYGFESHSWTQSREGMHRTSVNTFGIHHPRKLWYQ